MGYLLNGVDTGGVPINLINSIIDGYNVPYFVETGTAGGESTMIASRNFTKCYTIELVDNITPFRDFPINVEFLKGNSGQLINNLINKLTGEYTVFWLDAHYSAPSEDSPNTPDDYEECPLMDELNAISIHQKAIIVIDDARLFLGAVPAPLDPRKWVSVSDIFKCFSEKFPNHHYTLVDDYIICVPIEMKDNLNREWRARYKQRYPVGIEQTKMHAREAFKALQDFIK